jgi:hypothetical protein
MLGILGVAEACANAPLNFASRASPIKKLLQIQRQGVSKNVSVCGLFIYGCVYDNFSSQGFLSFIIKGETRIEKL